MLIHWSYKSLPELSALSDAERKAVWKKATRQAREQWQTLLAVTIVSVSMLYVGDWLGSRFGEYFLGLVIAGAIATVICERIIFRTARSYLKETIGRSDKA